MNFLKQRQDIVLLVIMTLLLVYDFFNGVRLDGGVNQLSLLLIIFGLYLITLNAKKSKTQNEKEILNWQIFITCYLVVLIGLLTAFGGESTSGISLSNVFFWAVVAISIIEIIVQWKKVKHVEAT
ncbi:hypothetical protein [Tenuibacillus multivorans]|uniref:Uncharacterized protein n=1 Tax=Tenuibacillus multivorans TaxID=237069 RepID=A0A1G9X6R7_9BACI|nr:hypothetical protein [Tenuibacillus multivorans]GEL78652.1 hypothetical protein TMU01_28870 [Tenuibacillus multivorans]SDM92206.1 hypothetical protein SAMN05216498_1030 [Tenuibacillus multivorans]